MVERATNSNYVPQYNVDYSFQDGKRFGDIVKIFNNPKALSALKKTEGVAIQRVLSDVEQETNSLVGALVKQHNFAVIDNAMIYETEHQINNSGKEESQQAVKTSYTALIKAITKAKEVYDRNKVELHSPSNPGSLRISSGNHPSPAVSQLPPATTTAAPQQQPAIKLGGDVQQLLAQVAPLLRRRAIVDRKSKAAGVIKAINQRIGLYPGTTTPKERAELKALKEALEKLQVQLLLDQANSLLLEKNPENPRITQLIRKMRVKCTSLLSGSQIKTELTNKIDLLSKKLKI